MKTVIFDNIQNFTNIHQLSQVFRYVTFSKHSLWKSIGIKNESSLNFTMVEDQTTSEIVQLILQNVEERAVIANE